MAVVTMPGVVTPDRPVDAQPQPDLIAMLERLLERARAGDLQALIFATVDSQRGIGTGWSGSSSSTDVAAALFWLSFRYGKAFDGSSDDDQQKWGA